MVKSKKSKDKKKVVVSPQPIVEAPPVQIEEPKVIVKKDWRIITVSLESFENLVAVFAISDVVTKLKYLEKDIGETVIIPITDDPYLPIGQSFSIKFDANSKQDIDQLVSQPVTFTIIQSVGTFDPVLYEQLKIYEERKPTDSQKSLDSVVSLYEAITGDKLSRSATTLSKKKKDKKDKKPVKGNKKTSKTSAKSKSSQTTKKSEKSKGSKKSSKKSNASTTPDSVKKKEETAEPVVYGMCVLDLLPLIYGNQNYAETLPIKPIKAHCDERMQRYKLNPRLVVNITIDKPLEFDVKPMILNFTLESVYNLPSLMGREKVYKICTMMPNENSLEPMCFLNPVYTNKIQEEPMKCWPGIQKIGDNANTTNYKIDTNFDHIKNTVGYDISKYLVDEENNRLEFNCLKRNYVLREGKLQISRQVNKYQKIVVEFYMTTKTKTKQVVEDPNKTTTGNTPKKKKGKKSDRSSVVEQNVQSETPPPPKQQPYLHLMTILDLSKLLYPGITRTRVASKLRTYHAKEALTFAGLEDSFFFPKPKVVNVEKIVEKKVKEEKQGKGKKGSSKKASSKKSSKKGSKKGSKKESKKESKKGSKKESKKGSKKESKKGSKKESKKGSKKASKTSSKSSKGKKKGPSKDLKGLLPPKPAPEPEEEPSMEVFTEDGRPCFVIIEIELSEPINEVRPIEDIQEDLRELLQKNIQEAPKIILSPCLSRDFYQETINIILYGLYKEYLVYFDKKEKCLCEDKADFIVYLQRTHTYQTYLTSLVKATSVVVAHKFKFDNIEKDSLEYQSLIGEVFVYLVSQMNQVLNRQICTSLEPVIEGPLKSMDSALFYAREATHLRRYSLAERYLMERLCNDENNSDFWFDYAIFNLEIQNYNKAFQCIKEALCKKMDHKMSLLLFGIFLTDAGKNEEAETCFLTLVVQEPRMLEAWGVLYLFYEKYEKYEGIGMAMDMCKKYLEDPRTPSHYFLESEDLVWTPTICPNTIFFRTASILLKMRMFDWVENALAHEVSQNYGETNYLMAVVCYYKELYVHALDHIEVAKFHHGSDYAVAGLAGHCYLALEKLEEAKEEYYYILKAFSRPDDMHLIYINTAHILEELGDHQEARKLMLLACKYNPSPYTWRKVGQLYLMENDLLSAEECLSEANLRDNRCSEIWGLLALVNLKLQRVSEAELCFSQAIKHNLGDEEILEKIRRESIKINN